MNLAHAKLIYFLSKLINLKNDIWKVRIILSISLVFTFFIIA